MAVETVVERQGRREVLMNVYGSDGASLLGTLPGEDTETVGEVFARGRVELGFGGQGSLCLSRRIRTGSQDEWESIPEGARLGEIAIDDETDVAIDEDAQLGLA